jgi:predicted N-acetyltransferase YhbS
MQVMVRPAGEADAQECGRICHDAFAAIASRHGFPPDFPSVEIATALVSELVAHPGFFSVVAEQDGRVVGSNFLDERSLIFGVGPVTVDPAVQDRQIGRALMNAVLDRTAERRAPGVRLLQAAYHNRSMSLYAKLGFDVREPFAVMQGHPVALEIPGYHVRAANDADVQPSNALCSRVHGHDRGGELDDALAPFSALLGVKVCGFECCCGAVCFGPWKGDIEVGEDEPLHGGEPVEDESAGGVGGV